MEEYKQSIVHKLSLFTVVMFALDRYDNINISE